MLPQLAWQTTRNTYEAAALNALRIAAKPVTMKPHDSRGHDITEWHLQPASDDAAHRTGILRRDFNGGQVKGIFVGVPLHPYLIACRVMHNRHRFLDAQNGRSMRSVEEAPGSWVLAAGHTPPSLLTGPYIETMDPDRALALIGLGSGIISITGPAGAHTYRLTRFALPSEKLPGQAVDNGIWNERMRDQLISPDHAASHCGIQLHALHCLRELRKRQHSNSFIIVSHRVPFFKGAAVKADAAGAALNHVQRTLGVKL